MVGLALLGMTGRENCRGDDGVAAAGIRIY